jgi:flagellar biosynthesis regulator FlbT
MHLPSELGKLSDMSTGEQHIIHIKDEEDGTPIRCVLTIEAMVLIQPKKADRLHEIIELLVSLSQTLFQSVQALP